ncbi:MAG: hypothetical protein EA350_08725 [Gemmatimonadales bacterium]|nr:MAG: hypothetical protein EA350_08725 [Gemmatimonadales bacterium]
MRLEQGGAACVPPGPPGQALPCGSRCHDGEARLHRHLDDLGRAAPPAGSPPQEAGPGLSGPCREGHRGGLFSLVLAPHHDPPRGRAGTCVQALPVLTGRQRRLRRGPVESRAVASVRGPAGRGLERGRDFWICALLFVFFLPLRLPFRAEFLINWDAVNLGLGTHLFNLQNHQPHPPGYIGYVAVGWLLNQFTGDANTSLTFLSALSGALAPAGFFLLASRFMSTRFAVIAAVLLGLSPPVWYYSGVALTYAPELALALFFLWAGFVARQHGSPRHMLVATVLLVLLGAMRPSGALLLMPMWLYMVRGLGWRARFTMGGVLVAGNLAWLGPLFWLSGGIPAFFQASSELANLVVVPTSVFSGGPGAGQGQNIAFVLLGLLLGIHLGLFVIAAGLIIDSRAFGVFRRHAVFFLLWLVPALMVYLLLHTGQLGYVLILLPAFFLLVGVALEAVARRLALREPARVRRRPGAMPAAVAAMVLVLVLGSGTAFLGAPLVVRSLTQSVGTGIEGSEGAPRARPLHRITPHLTGVGVGSNVRQFDVRGSDAHWRALIGFVQRHDPGEVVVLAAPNSAGSFRHLTYYLPDYRVYALGWDLEGGFGHLFTAQGRGSDYSVQGLRRASRQLHLPPGVRWLVVPDAEVVIRLEGFTGGKLWDLEGGPPVLVLPVEPGGSMVVEHTVHLGPVFRPDVAREAGEERAARERGARGL